MKYYTVTCKLGHHGATRHEDIVFAIAANNAVEATDKARKMPGVKHDKTNTVTKLVEISEEEYNERRKTSAYENVWKDKK